ncbi:MAG TPA: hypothetical protein VM510_17880 [Caulifigura sp.]|nr:hypothetical protein [Caulifigura sp.]
MLIRPGAVVVALFASALAISAAVACPFCDAPEPSLAEQLSQADAAVLVQWKSAEQANTEKQTFGSTTFAVVNIVRQPGTDYEKGSTIKLDRYRPGKPGDLFLLLGTKVDGIEWGSPLEVTETSFNYITQSPGREVPAAKRLPFFLKYLEHPDELISKDAFSEFAAAPYSDIAPLADQFSAAQVKEWIAKKETNQTRIGFYGMMLGLCGTKSDAEFLKSEINRPTETYRLGLDGLMAGYVLLLGDDGIGLLEEKLGQNTKQFSDTYAAMQTLRFMWQYASNRVSKDRLRLAMRMLIDRPEFADLAIKDLARWEDWDVMPKLMEVYESPSHGSSQTKRAVALFLITLSKKKAPDGDQAMAKHIEAAKAHLEDLKSRDPKIVKDAEKYFF